MKANKETVCGYESCDIKKVTKKFVSGLTLGTVIRAYFKDCEESIDYVVILVPQDKDPFSIQVVEVNDWGKKALTRPYQLNTDKFYELGTSTLNCKYN